MPGSHYCYFFTTTHATIGRITYLTQACRILQDVPDHTGIFDPYALSLSLPGSTIFPQRKYYIGRILCILYGYYVISCLCQICHACMHALNTYNIFGQK